MGDPVFGGIGYGTSKLAKIARFFGLFEICKNTFKRAHI